MFTRETDNHGQSEGREIGCCNKLSLLNNQETTKVVTSDTSEEQVK